MARGKKKGTRQKRSIGRRVFMRQYSRAYDNNHPDIEPYQRKKARRYKKLLGIPLIPVLVVAFLLFTVKGKEIVSGFTAKKSA